MFEYDNKKINFLSNHMLFPYNFIVFSCNDQKAYFKRANKIFIDGTFRETPKDFKNGQLINILILHNETNVYIPVVHILMQSKLYEEYKYIFNLLKISGCWPKPD